MWGLLHVLSSVRLCRSGDVAGSLVAVAVWGDGMTDGIVDAESAGGLRDVEKNQKRISRDTAEEPGEVPGSTEGAHPTGRLDIQGSQGGIEPGE